MNVGVVGAGFAGLRAATLLRRAGAEVKVFEARNRLGGRCRTVDDGAGLRYEAGGEWLDADHARCVALMAEHGLAPAVSDSGPRRYLHRGVSCDDNSLWPDAVADDPAVAAEVAEIGRRLKLPHAANVAEAALDGANVADFLRSLCSSERGFWLQTSRWRSDEGEDLERVGLLGWLANGLLYADREGDELSAFRFPGGTSHILALMAEDVDLNRDLAAVRHDPLGATLEFVDGGRERFDRVVLTLPPRALEKVVFEPPLPALKRCAIEGAGMGRSVKIALEFDRPWWTEIGWGGSMQCDTPLQQTWEGTLGERPVLLAYVCGEETVRWGRHPDPARAALADLTTHFPQAADRFVRGRIHDWPADRWAGGGFSYIPPNFALGGLADLAPPVGPVHFAGEHTALWVGFIEGALESAERVAQEIL